MFKILIPVVSALLIYGAESLCTRRVCYHSNWSQHRKGLGRFGPENIDPELCTHLIYMFAKLEAGNKIGDTEWNDKDKHWGGPGQYTIFNNLKKKNPNLKTLLCVGGWVTNGFAFSTMVKSKHSRKSFITNAIQYLRDYKFDGLDLNWETLGHPKSQSTDRRNFSFLLKELLAAFKVESSKTGKPRLLLSASVHAFKYYIFRGYDVPVVSRNVDMLNIMTFDFHGTWENKTGHNSPLYNRPEERGKDVYLNVDFALNYWVHLGAPKQKINMGLPTYGREFSVRGDTRVLPGDTVSTLNNKEYYRDHGHVPYYKICDRLARGYKKTIIESQMVPYMQRRASWVGYDDVNSFRLKTAYINAGGYGGYAVFTLAMDDFRGAACNQGKYPLVNAAKNICMSGSTIVENAVICSSRQNQGVASVYVDSTVFEFHTLLLSQLFVTSALLYTMRC